MKYRNKSTGIIVEPSCELAAQAFLNPPWEEVQECLQSEQTATSPLQKQMNISVSDTQATAKTENVGKNSARRTKKSS